MLRERARRTEQLRRVPDETISDLRDAGLLKLLQPARYGGYEADMATFFEIALTLQPRMARSVGSTACCRYTRGCCR